MKNHLLFTLFFLCNSIAILAQAVSVNNVYLCSISQQSVTQNLNNFVNGADTFSILQSPFYGSVNLAGNGNFTYIPNTTQVEDFFIYNACNILGECASDTVFIQLADTDGPPSDITSITNIELTAFSPKEICNANIGTSFLMNCQASLYTVCFSNNEQLGSLSYANPDCVFYTPIQNGIDTITISYCGDIAAVFDIYTCNGWETITVGPCTKELYIINSINAIVSQTFTETHEINCDSTIAISGLGYPTWNAAVITQNPNHGTAIISPFGVNTQSLIYTPNQGFMGTDTIIVDCAHATQITCQTGIYIFNVTCTNETNNFSNENVEIFPNPSKAGFTINGIDNNAQMTIYNASGQACLATKVNNQEYISCEQLPNGIYWIHLINRDISLSLKFIKLQ